MPQLHLRMMEEKADAKESTHPEYLFLIMAMLCEYLFLFMAMLLTVSISTHECEQASFPETFLPPYALPFVSSNEQ